ncbi:MAG TPA: hypothetical protein PKC43_10525 [Phycisphaerales bacterium]|nr:hypothetical protein [Phycisphaerales bacterium]HMP37870.1 hypothetical protein [Phycisphaerales bacterium]
MTSQPAVLRGVSVMPPSAIGATEVPGPTTVSCPGAAMLIARVLLGA